MGLQARLRTRIAIAVAVLLCAVLAWLPGHGQADAPVVAELFLHDTLQQASARTLDRALQVAGEQHAAALLVSLSTPGGLPASAEQMARAIRNAPMPVLVFAQTPNTRVSGEGLRLLAAGDVAAMAPGTFLTPLRSDPPRVRDSAQESREAQELADAVTQLTRSAGRDPQAVVAAVNGESWVSADAARLSGLVDVVAVDEASLLRAVEGHPLPLRGGRRLPLLSRAQIVPVDPTLPERLMRALMNPDLTVLMLALGGLLVYLEFNTPGTILPGAAGLLLILLALYALHQLPLRGYALMLLVLSSALLLLETRVPRHGVLAALGVCVLPFGLATLVDGPIRELEVGWPTALGAGMGFGGVTAILVVLGMEARRAKRRTGAEAMLGWMAIAQTPLAPRGRVLVRGELWSARLTSSETAVEAGAPVRVLRADGQMLEVTSLARPVEEVL